MATTIPIDLTVKNLQMYLGTVIAVVRAADITASSPDEKDPFFAPSGDKVYRHPTYYSIPESVPHI